MSNAELARRLLEWIVNKKSSWLPGEGNERVYSFTFTEAEKDMLLAALEAEHLQGKDAQDAARYRFLKERLTVPGAMQHFLRFNNMHPDTKFEPSIDAAIDAAMSARVESSEGEKK